MATCLQNHPKQARPDSRCKLLLVSGTRSALPRTRRGMHPASLLSLQLKFNCGRMLRHLDLRESLVTMTMKVRPGPKQRKGWRCCLLPPPAIRGIEARQGGHALRPKIKPAVQCVQGSQARKPPDRWMCLAFMVLLILLFREDRRCKHKHPAASPHFLGTLKGSCLSG